MNPAAIQREIQALTDQLLTVTTGKKGPSQDQPPRPPLRAYPPMSQRPRLRAHLDESPGPVVPGMLAMLITGYALTWYMEGAV